MKKKEQKLFIKYSEVKNWGSKKIHQELATTLAADACGRPQVKI
jgi:hypothetical protein